ncbi:hypothetical protein [Flammeovirga pacifica]|uniref:hypothetical protein n=1 Tax=Flammeovirga pacifica TaxID=915059 RepID=UPI0013013CD4|nr:hypothetical protein [Flammeovirga pacifica]
MELIIGIILISMPILFALGLLGFMMTGPKEEPKMNHLNVEDKEENHPSFEVKKTIAS